MTSRGVYTAPIAAVDGKINAAADKERTAFVFIG